MARQGKGIDLMLKFVVLDVETTGLPMRAERGAPPIPADAPGQPRLASFCVIALDENLVEIEQDSIAALIKPDGWEIGAEASAVNGLTTERCAAEGIPVADVLGVYSDLIGRGAIVVAHNVIFDTKIMRGELRRAFLPDLFKQTRIICTMRAAADVITPGRKQVKLIDAYRHFFESDFADAHTAQADARACLALLRKLTEIGCCPEPQINYARSVSAGKGEAA
jgi:DNA polymerase III subunit epsilon